MIDNRYLFYTDYIHMYQLRFRLSDNSLSHDYFLPCLRPAWWTIFQVPPVNDDVTRSQFPLCFQGIVLLVIIVLVLVKGHMNTVTKCCTEAVELAVYYLERTLHWDRCTQFMLVPLHIHPHTHTQWGSTGICHCPTMGLLLELHKTKMGLELRLEESKTDIAR